MEEWQKCWDDVVGAICNMESVRVLLNETSFHTICRTERQFWLTDLNVWHATDFLNLIQLIIY